MIGERLVALCLVKNVTRIQKISCTIDTFNTVHFCTFWRLAITISIPFVYFEYFTKAYKTKCQPEIAYSDFFVFVFVFLFFNVINEFWYVLVIIKVDILSIQDFICLIDYINWILAVKHVQNEILFPNTMHTRIF